MCCLWLCTGKLPFLAMEVEDQIRRIMDGEGLEFTELDVHPDQAKPATLRKTVSYIVCAVILNDQVRMLSYSLVS